jgi:hypothetical protein
LKRKSAPSRGRCRVRMRNPPKCCSRHY